MFVDLDRINRAVRDTFGDALGYRDFQIHFSSILPSQSSLLLRGGIYARRGDKFLVEPLEFSFHDLPHGRDEIACVNFALDECREALKKLQDQIDALQQEGAPA